MAEWEGAKIRRFWINFGFENGKLVEWDVWNSSLLDLKINGTYMVCVYGRLYKGWVGGILLGLSLEMIIRRNRWCGVVLAK